jgi:hypothetical protein
MHVVDIVQVSSTLICVGMPEGNDLRESWKSRLDDLEAAREQRDAPVIVGHIMFVDAAGNLEDPVIACDGGDFVCHRASGEDLEAFIDRADAACAARHSGSYFPPPILVLFPSESANDPLA